MQSSTCVAVGPGLGRGDAVTQVVADIYSRHDGPMVVDADGINALAALEEVPKSAGPRVLTPHIGEFRRLANNTLLSSSACRHAAPTLARETGSVVVVKGPRTLVTDGTVHYENSTGNPGMATGGSGDVLTGIIAALLAQGEPIWDGTKLGVYVHGLAGDIARDAVGEISMTAQDLVDHLPQAFAQIQSSLHGRRQT